MTVFVDEPIFPYRGQLWCHMHSPDTSELHEMAQKIGLKRSWFQNHRGKEFPHYDLSPKMREKAVRLGATAVTCREMVLIVRGVPVTVYEDDKYILTEWESAEGERL